MDRPRIVVAHGARATEELVAARVAELRRAARDDLTLLARPVLLVVPSASLRDHLSAVLVRRCGALVGCRVTTLFSVALELLAASGRPAPRGTALFDVLVRRFARLAPPLSERLDDLVDGYGVVCATVRDFLDAGFEPVHREALGELLDTEAPALATGEEIARASALVEIAAATQRGLEELGLVHRSALLRAARDALEARGPELLPTRELLVHGFAEATGVATDLLESLLRASGGTLYLDRPPNGAGGWEAAHTERLVAHLTQVAQTEEAEADAGSLETRAEASIETVDFFAAPDPEAEMREIARRVGALLADGARPEAIGIVARDFGARGSGVPGQGARGALVRRHFGALGIPFSAVGAAGPLGPVGRDLAALRELLRRGPSLHLERWLDLLHDLETEPPADAVELTPGLRSGLRLAFFALGASRLEDLERIETTDAIRAPRAIDPGVLAAAAAAGRGLAVELGEWRRPGKLAFADHLEHLDRVLGRHLGWTKEREDEGEGRGARAVADEAVRALDVPAALPLTHDEFVLVLVEALAGRETEPLGGRGGGVRVLGAMEARGLTFEHLFLFAVGRGVFPRPVREDPLLPDRLRRGLARLLPDLPIKAAGTGEERHLFAQLRSAAPRLTVSWHEEDAAGNAVAPSPLVERLRRGEETPAPRAPRVLAPEAQAWRPAVEELLVSAVHGDRERFGRILPLALEETRTENDAEAPLVAPAKLAGARVAVLEELDPDRRTRSGRLRGRRLGPYYGFLGAAGEGDPRRGPVYVTTLENLAVCSWQTFLRRLLRVEPMPDPLASLPTLRGQLVGNLVHRVLERIAADALGAGRSPGGVVAAWPEPAALEALLAVQAEQLLREQGLGLKGLARAAAELAHPYLEVARRLDWAARAPAVERVEATETLRLAAAEGRERRVRFRADRVDRGAAGAIRTDYKTGAPRRARRDGRRTLGEGIASGEWLQAAAYVHGEDAEAGRYLFLRPDLDDEDRVLRLEAGDAELRSLFAETAGTLLDAWDGGTFFPRLVEPDEDLEPPRCRSCRVAEACLRRDSGARGRLRRWAQARREGAEKEISEIDAKLLAVWRLRSKG